MIYTHICIYLHICIYIYKAAPKLIKLVILGNNRW